MMTLPITSILHQDGTFPLIFPNYHQDGPSLYLQKGRLRLCLHLQAGHADFATLALLTKDEAYTK